MKKDFLLILTISKQKWGFGDKKNWKKEKIERGGKYFGIKTLMFESKSKGRDKRKNKNYNMWEDIFKNKRKLYITNTASIQNKYGKKACWDKILVHCKLHKIN